jgi:hypothetical protein
MAEAQVKVAKGKRACPTKTKRIREDDDGPVMKKKVQDR